MFELTGTLLDTTRETGDKVIDGTQVIWDFTVLHVLVGREVHKVRLPKGVHTHRLPVGEAVLLNVDVPPKTRFTTDLESIGLAPADAASSAAA